jgi:hypothetical protein
MFLRRNTAGQVFTIPGSLRAVADGSAVTSGTIHVQKDGTDAAGAGTLTHLREGCFQYAPTAGESDCQILGYTLIGTGAIPLSGSVRTTNADPDDGTDLGLANLDAAVSSRSTLGTGDLAGLSTFDPATDPVNLQVDQSQVLSLGGLAVGGAAIDANLVSVNGEAVTGGTPEVDVVSVNGEAITPGIDPADLAAVADAVHDEAVEGTVTFRKLLRGFAAALLAKASGMSTTTGTFRDLGDTKDRIVATVDPDTGDRSAITLDLD